MIKLLPILFMSILLPAELEVDGDLKVTGSVESATIDSLQQQINSLLLLIADLELRIANMECLNTGIIPEGYCDCYGNALDLCGVCAGDDMTCTDCAGVLNGDSTEDNCGNCDNDSSNDCVQDCFGEWGGTAVEDVCGDCGGDAISESECYDAYDADGNGYNSVEIGSQIWLTENLRTTSYLSGEPIPTGISDAAWAEGLNYGAYAVYDNNDDNAELYGLLYNVHIAHDEVCPQDWHVPSDAEWQVLIENLGGYSVAGGELKEMGETYWSGNTGATNGSNFSARGAGYRWQQNGTFKFLTDITYIWTSTDNTSIELQDYDAVASTYSPPSSSDWNAGYSIRCIKD